MTNHSETTGPSDNDGITGLHRADQVACTAYDGHGAEHEVTLRTPAELADALPYLLGYRPEDSIVLVALHDRGGRGRFGGRARLGIPASPDDWPSAARQLVHGLITGSERRGARPEQMVAYVCQEPPPGRSGREVMERLRPLVQRLRVECGALDVPVIEALCISDGRFWSYCCAGGACCPAEGTPMGLPGTSVLAAAATYAGIQVRGSLSELRARLLPRENSAALDQEVALDAAGMTLIPRMLDGTSRAEVAEETLALATRVMGRLAAAPTVSGAVTADARDDELLAHDEAAKLILGLQDRTTRDRAAEWMEGDEAAPALRLWRALARRCVGAYGEYAAPPLTLAGWVAWSTGDELEAREALAMALGADPDYLFARLLHQACNEGLDPESVRRCLRAERGDPGDTAPGAARSRADASRPMEHQERQERQDQKVSEPEPASESESESEPHPEPGAGLESAADRAPAPEDLAPASAAASAPALPPGGLAPALHPVPPSGLAPASGPVSAPNAEAASDGLASASGPVPAPDLMSAPRPMSAPDRTFALGPAPVPGRSSGPSPVPVPEAVPARRRRPRSGGAADGTVRREAVRGRGAGADGARPRTPAGSTRPGGARTGTARTRTAGTGGARRTGGTTGSRRDRRPGDGDAGGSGTERGE
ncbi:DUF4192 domain-containing protein [Streptomyces leeuwenhoekii]|uniref:DUF4192 domain-containing protein n=1 Tax=Streptomyces leeuwenhoekii TaxID=1437453 RepID=A0A0F7VS11_STRLW|nr:DUF4192 domain-containing protein [Streptomyces leeuwenhoekii]CQR61318.1 Conserved Hypothetical Protein [Streptomyces leeuwenhoekii]